MPTASNRRIALVTGAGRRLGRAIALELARTGCDLIVHYLSSSQGAHAVAEAARTLGVEAITIKADLADPAAIAGMFEEAFREFGRLDILVNSAGVFRRTPPEALDEEAFDYHLSVNLKAPYLCCIQAARLMRKCPGAGKIVNIADAAAQKPMRNYVPYCVSKAGLVMLTRALAKAFAPSIQVNAVAPGYIVFPEDGMNSDMPITTPEEVAAAVVRLCEPGSITGMVIEVPGSPVR